MYNQVVETILSKSNVIEKKRRKGRESRKQGVDNDYKSNFIQKTFWQKHIKLGL